jgi:rod shape-determining protein MreC
MALGTLESSPPPFFKQGPSAFTKLIFFSALSALLMFADVRYTLIQPIRWSLSMVLYPVQWMARQPIELWEGSIQYFESRDNAQAQVASSKIQLLKLSVRATQVEQLQLENQQLRQLLALSERQNSSGVIAQVIYDAPDPYTRKFILNKGSAQGIKLSSPVMDELGILGQITRCIRW